MTYLVYTVNLLTSKHFCGVSLGQLLAERVYLMSLAMNNMVLPFILLLALVCLGWR